VLSGVFRGERREVSFVVACLTFEPEWSLHWQSPMQILISPFQCLPARTKDKLRWWKAELVILLLHKVLILAEAGAVINIDINNGVLFVPELP
jgi:hypothetical protein